MAFRCYRLPRFVRRQRGDDGISVDLPGRGRTHDFPANHVGVKNVSGLNKHEKLEGILRRSQLAVQ